MFIILQRKETSSMIQKAVQQIMLGSVTGTETAARQTLNAIREAGYDALELNGFMIRPTSFLVRALTKAAGMPTGKGGKLDWPSLLKETGLGVVSVHEDLGRIENETAAVIEEARLFGCRYIVITGMYRFDYTDPAEVSGLVRRLNAAGEKLSAEGVSLLYHNHNIEFSRLPDGYTAWDRLLAETDPAFVNFEFDSYWPTEAGADAMALMKQLGSRMKLWHINDRGFRASGKQMTPILKSDSLELGTGNMPLVSLLGQAKASGVDAVILESHRNWIDGSPVRSLQKSAEFLRKQL